MNRKANTILFMLGATVFNVLVVILTFFALIIPYFKFLEPHAPEGTQLWSISFIFLASIASSFVAYRYLLKFLMAKIDFEKYFDPLFVKQNIKKK